jgi:2-polyprenyl-6-methoxyphenol hydroxylase-like FAD-dependent oxidoreductase
MSLTTFEKAVAADGSAFSDRADVIVAGAGPVGLMLACELALAGLEVTVIERLTRISPTVKAGSVNVPTMEALYRRGLLPAVQEAEQEAAERFRAFVRQRHPDAPAAARAPRPAGHFAGLWLSADQLDPADPAFAGHGPAGSGAMITQQVIEEILGRRAAQLGVDVRRGVELAGFDDNGSGVTVTVRPADDAGPADGKAGGPGQGPAGGPGTRQLRAGWLVGCDGGRSLVRRLAGFDFPGTPPQMTGHQAVVELADDTGLRLGWNRTERGTYVYGPVPGRILTVEFDGAPQDRDAPVTTAELQASLRFVSGADVTITAVHSATRFTDNARQVPCYRRGRVLLAGDAAHVHAPFGGQGLNLGIGDALNLGWKLAAVARGAAGEPLLDSYTAERHPVGAWALDWSRAQVALMRPEPGPAALSQVIRDLMDTTDGATYFVKKISGLTQRYDAAAGPGAGGHPLTGASAPDLALDDGTRLGDHLHDGGGLLLDLADDPRWRELAAGWTGRVTVRRASSQDQPQLSGLLVRPDGFVAWAADRGQDGPAPDSAESCLQAALGTWFGAPAGQAEAAPSRLLLLPAAGLTPPVAPGAVHLADHRQRGEVAGGQGAAADTDVYRYAALLRPVDVLQVEQQSELVHDEGQPTAVGERGGRVTTVLLRAAHRDRAHASQQSDAPHVMVQVAAADAQVPERALARPDGVGYPAHTAERSGKREPADQGRLLPGVELGEERVVDVRQQRLLIFHYAHDTPAQGEAPNEIRGWRRPWCSCARAASRPAASRAGTGPGRPAPR